MTYFSQTAVRKESVVFYRVQGLGKGIEMAFRMADDTGYTHWERTGCVLGVDD